LFSENVVNTSAVGLVVIFASGKFFPLKPIPFVLLICVTTEAGM
jgi:hypothetical protein